jgi:hypothetical protein
MYILQSAFTAKEHLFWTWALGKISTECKEERSKMHLAPIFCKQQLQQVVGM